MSVAYRSSSSPSSFFDISSRTIAYFSMEIALAPEVPTYSGGLGVLAGDTLRSAADAGTPMVAVSLAHRKGYFKQSLSAEGQQTEADVPWSPERRLPSAQRRIELWMNGRRCWSRRGGSMWWAWRGM